jgi:EAL domain-containing protein (putative c-di-GMP-specific phosphodiesterase class I)
VELTESELLVSTAATSLAVLRAAGVAIAIDDFGTGYSSLAYLADLPLDTVKLDQSFIRRLHAGGRANTLVTGLVDFVHDLGFAVVAEGVEERHQSDVLSELGVEWQQGFLFSRPLPAEQAERWLQERGAAGRPA